MEKLKNIVKQDEVKLTDKEKMFVKNLSTKRDSAAERYPVLFTGAAAFGLVSTYYGFEKLIDRIDIFVDNPWILLLSGVSILILTGTLYKKL